MINPAGLGEPPGLAPKDIAIDARLQAVLIMRQGVEVEIEDTLTVALTDDAWK